ncbi:hypothetical protein [Paraburkholderia sartisoli]|nr:hypothetical protein [Paraburkholderia sartisoli]
MAVDFSLLPPEVKVPDEPPSRFLWSIIFFGLMLLGAFAILMLWPRNEPDRTAWFWFCLSIYPAGISAFIVSRRFSVYEGRRLDAQDWNAARERYVDGVFAQAAVPLVVLGAACRFVDDDKRNSAEAIAERTVVLKAQPSIAQPGTVTARWFSPPAVDRSKWQRGPDTVRQSQILEWLFERLIDQLAETVQGLPTALPLTVQLSVAADALEVSASAVWKKCWRGRELRPAQVRMERADPKLMSVDTWLDSNDPMVRKHATLRVTIQLNSILNRNPPHGSAEAGAALLFVPEEISKLYEPKPIAFVHRPMSGSLDELDHVLTYALRWGKSERASVRRLWLSGVDTNGVAPLHAALNDVDVTPGRAEPLLEMDMDFTVGNSGAAASLLSLACAAASASSFGAKQLLVEQRGNDVVLAVIAPASLQKNRRPDPSA